MICKLSKGTHNDIPIELASGPRLHGRRIEVVDIVVEDNVNSAGGEILLDPLAVFVRVRGIEKLRVRVDDGNLLVGERILNFASIF